MGSYCGGFIIFQDKRFLLGRTNVIKLNANQENKTFTIQPNLTNIMVMVLGVFDPESGRAKTKSRPA